MNISEFSDRFFNQYDDEVYLLPFIIQICNHLTLEKNTKKLNYNILLIINYKLLIYNIIYVILYDYLFKIKF